MKRGRINFVVSVHSNMIDCTQKFTCEGKANKFCRQIKKLHDNMLKHHGYDKKVKPTDFYSDRYDCEGPNKRLFTKDSKKMSKRRSVLPLLEKNEVALEKVGRLKIQVERVNK